MLTVFRILKPSVKFTNAKKSRKYHFCLFGCMLCVCVCMCVCVLGCVKLVLKINMFTIQNSKTRNKPDTSLHTFVLHQSLKMFWDASSLSWRSTFLPYKSSRLKINQTHIYTLSYCIKAWKCVGMHRACLETQNFTIKNRRQKRNLTHIYSFLYEFGGAKCWWNWARNNF